MDRDPVCHLLVSRLALLISIICVNDMPVLRVRLARPRYVNDYRACGRSSMRSDQIVLSHKLGRRFSYPESAAPAEAAAAYPPTTIQADSCKEPCNRISTKKGLSCSSSSQVSEIGMETMFVRS